jgi:hypothetical protein
MSGKRNASRVFSKALFATIVLFGSISWAQANEEFDSWQNKLSPFYIWGMSMSGSMISGPVSAPIEIDFNDAVSDLESVLTLHYEGAKGNWGIIADRSFLNLTPSMESEGPVPIAVNGDLKNTITEIAGLYRFGPDSPWELLAGLRQYQLDVKVTGLPGPSGSLAIDETFNDVFIGGRYIRNINDRWSFIGRADVGTGDSDLVWNAFAAFDYRFTKLLSGLVGWRVVEYDVDTGSGAERLQYDMTHSGPGLALTFHW